MIALNGSELDKSDTEIKFQLNFSLLLLFRTRIMSLKYGGILYFSSTTFHSIGDFWSSRLY